MTLCREWIKHFYVVIFRIFLPGFLVFSVFYHSFKVYLETSASEFTFTLFYSSPEISIIAYAAFLLATGLEYSLTLFRFFGKVVPYDFIFLMIGWLIFLVNNLFYGSAQKHWTLALSLAVAVDGLFLIINTAIYFGVVIGFGFYVVLAVCCYRRSLREVLRYNYTTDNADEPPPGLTQRELETLKVQKYNLAVHIMEVSQEMERNNEENSKIIFDFEAENLPIENHLAGRPLLEASGEEEKEEERSALEICSICQREFENEELVTYLPICKHCYHAQCLKPWLLRNRNCPMCRREAIQSPNPTT